MKALKITRNQYAIVDDDDYEILKRWKWTCRSDGYAMRMSSKVNGKRRLCMMHAFIMKTPQGMHTDHINNNKLDNRKQNLRICTPAQNQVRSFKKNNTSGFKGVSWNKDKKKWDARTYYKNKQVFIGYFEDKAEAANAFNNKVKDLYGEFAYLNKI